MRTGNEANKNSLKYNEYSHGFDYMVYAIKNDEIVSPFFTERIENLDTDNSNYGAIKFVDEILAIHKYKAPTGEAYQFSLTYNSVPVPIFEITKFSESQSTFSNHQWGVTHFYGMYYRLIELGYLSEKFIKRISHIFYNAPISRFDYRFDFGHTDKKVELPTPDEVFPYLRKNKFRKLYYAGPRLQSWELGKKINKTIFIRLYNKLDELKGSLKKTILYGDFDKFKSYTRLEYEFGKKYCNGYLGKDVHLLVQSAFKTSGLEPSNFTGNVYKPTEKLDLNDSISKLRYIKIFLSMAKNLKNNGVNPISLIEEKC